MNAATFDTLKFVEILEAAKVPREQAIAFADAVRIAHNAADVATKNDVADLRKDTDNKFELLRKDIAMMEQRLDAKIEAQGNKNTIRVAGLFIAILGAIEVINRVWPVS